MDTGNSMVITVGKRGWGQAEEGKRGINGDRRRPDLGEHTIKYADDVS